MANEHSNIVPSMQPTAKVADFKFWCQKVLPLVYDDSLSYYEVLGKMVVYLNQVIDNINADIDNVAELEDDFILLQSYVNNFFDDIDQLVSYAERAEAAEEAANGYAASAAESATNASTSALNAMDAKEYAVAAKNQALSALADAQTAATNAAESATNAASSALTALDAKDAAAGSATSASGYATNAATSASAAQQSFTLADAARTAAQTSAGNASSSATDAAASATAAQTAAATADGAKAQAMIATEEEATAISAHDIGDYFRISGVLYRATAPIAIGDTISTSTNCTQAVLGNDVSTLKNNTNISFDFTNYLYSKYFHMDLHKEVQIVSGVVCERDVNIFNIPVNTNANDAYMSHRLLGVEGGFSANYSPDPTNDEIWTPITLFKQKTLSLICEYTNILGDGTGVGQTPRVGVYYRLSDNTVTSVSYTVLGANASGKAIIPIIPPENATDVLFVFNLRVKKASGGLYRFGFENYIPS